MKKFIILLLTVMFISPLAMAQDTLHVRSFDDLGTALEQKLKPLEQLEALPHDDCDCEECMAIKNKVADDVDKIVLDVDIELEPWQSRTFHEKIEHGMKKIEKLNELGEKIRKERLRQGRHTDCKSQLDNETTENKHKE